MTGSLATRRLLVAASFVSLSFLSSAPAMAMPVQLNFSGEVAVVGFDLGSTSFSGTMPGDRFSGTIVYDDTEGSFSFCEDLNSCVYPFVGPEYGGSIDGGPAVLGQSAVFIQDDYTFSQSEEPLQDLAIVNTILEPDITLFTPVDIWEAGAEVETSSGFTFVAFGTLSLNTSIQTSPDFDPVPPTATADAIFFILEEETGIGEYFAIGLVDSFEVVPIPVPAAGWLLLGALGALFRFTRRRDH